MRRDLRFIVLIREDLKVWCNYKGTTFSSVILRPWVLVRPESNSRPTAQLTEPLVRGVDEVFSLCVEGIFSFFVEDTYHYGLQTMSYWFRKNLTFFAKCRARGCLCELKDWVVLKEQVTHLMATTIIRSDYYCNNQRNNTTIFFSVLSTHPVHRLRQLNDPINLKDTKRLRSDWSQS